MEAIILLVKCSDCGKLFGIRMQKNKNNIWVCNWAFPINENIAKSEGYVNNTIEGKIQISKDYPGCPYCSALSFYKCICGKLNCWDGYSQNQNCSWCNESIEIKDLITKLEGGQF